MVQALNALAPIDFTEEGIVTETKEEQPKKVLLPIVAKVEGMVTCPSASGRIMHCPSVGEAVNAGRAEGKSMCCSVGRGEGLKEGTAVGRLEGEGVGRGEGSLPAAEETGVGSALGCGVGAAEGGQAQPGGGLHTGSTQQVFVSQNLSVRESTHLL